MVAYKSQVYFLVDLLEMSFFSSTIDAGSMRMKTHSETTSPLSPELVPSRTFVREGPVQLLSVSGHLISSVLLLTENGRRFEAFEFQRRLSLLFSVFFPSKSEIQYLSLFVNTLLPPQGIKYIKEAKEIFIFYFLIIQFIGL